jgi:DNA polymerase elongation subunit (family B)
VSNFYTNVKVIGNNICYRGIENGKEVRFKYEYSPTVFVPSKKESKFTSLSGNFVEELQPGSIKETKEFIKRYEEIDNFEILGEIGFDVQYLSDKFKGNIDWDINKISIQIIDIETSTELAGFPNKLTAPEEILLISLVDLATKNIVTFTTREYTGKNENKADIRVFQDEYSMLNSFLDYWNHIGVDIVSGWHTDGFDIPYIINRISNIMGDDHVKRLSPWRMVTSRKVKNQFGKEDIEYSIAGISSLDFKTLYTKFTYIKQENYSLDYISSVELGVGKLDHSEFSTFKDFYTYGWNKFVDYNIIDCIRVFDLEQKMKLIELCLTMSYLAKINYEDVFSQIRMWDAIIYNHLKSKNIVIPKKPSNTKSEQFEGAFVLEPVPGLYEWIVSFDATSLYPSIIQAWNISPETFVDVDESISVEKLMENVCSPSEEYTTAANGAMYTKEKKGLLPELIDIYMEKRKSAKKSMILAEQKLEVLKKSQHTSEEYKLIANEISRYNNEQMAFKIAMNSLYGAIGNAYCRYFKSENARAITLTGQYIIKTVAVGVNNDLNKMFMDKTNEKFDWVFYCDTDSNYVTLKPIVEKYYNNISNDKLVNIIDKISEEKITPIINKHCDNLQKYTNVLRNMISFKREAISTNGVWVAKKRYFLNVLDNEGVRYTSPKLKVMGLEVVKSSTPGVVRAKLKTCLSLILDNKEEDLQTFIADFKKEFNSLSIEEISFPRGVNGIEKYSNSTSIYSSGCPLHTKGAILFNKQLTELKLDNKYPKIGEGDKIKYTYLKMPNPIKDIVISFPSELPPEFNLNSYVDYDKQFTKTFIDPLTGVLDVINWNIERKFSIDDFFS